MKVVLLLGALVACADSNTDLGGIYMVTADVSSSPCGADMPAPMPPAYVHFTQGELFGAKVWTFEGCTDAAATMCDGGNGLFGGFSEPIDHGWKGVETSDSYSGTTCYLDYSERTAVLTGTMLVIESHDYNDMPALAQAACTTDEAEKRGTMMPCEMHERIEATKL